MEENQPNQQLNSYEIKRQQRIKEQQMINRKIKIKRAVKTLLISVSVTVPIVGLIWYAATRPSTPESDIVSKRGLHWHAQLSIDIKGKKQEVSANIGMSGVMASTHTHDTSGEIHLEKQGLVTKNDISLAQFFKIWGKKFDSNCILDSCNGPDGNLKLLINGKENTEFENYQMKDKDKVEIKYE